MIIDNQFITGMMTKKSTVIGIGLLAILFLSIAVTVPYVLLITSIMETSTEDTTTGQTTELTMSTPTEAPTTETSTTAPSMATTATMAATATTATMATTAETTVGTIDTTIRTTRMTR